MSFTTPKAFVELAERVILHRADDRFALLYRLLWRLQEAPALMRLSDDPEVVQARAMAREVVAAAQRMKAFLRFRPVQDALGEAFVAWFEPAQRVTEAVSPFFARRFTGRRFSILTPDVCAHWDGVALAFASSAELPQGDSLEAFWRREHAWALDPERWTDHPPLRSAPPGPGLSLPETGLMPELVARAEARGGESPDRATKAALRASRDAPYDGLPRTRGRR
jgi:uracil-DNA glycosylase